MWIVIAFATPKMNEAEGPDGYKNWNKGDSDQKFGPNNTQKKGPTWDPERKTMKFQHLFSFERNSDI